MVGIVARVSSLKECCEYLLRWRGGHRDAAEQVVVRSGDRHMARGVRFQVVSWLIVFLATLPTTVLVVGLHLTRAAAWSFAFATVVVIGQMMWDSFRWLLRRSSRR